MARLEAAGMADVLFDFPIRVDYKSVFEAISEPGGLDMWWTKTSSGAPVLGGVYELGFGSHGDWQAVVTCSVAGYEFELQMVKADKDWAGTHVGFKLTELDEGTWVQFHHTGWPEANDHYRISSNCWALYLRILRRWLENGEAVRYENRLDA